MNKTFNIKNRDRQINKKSGLEFSQISNHWIFKSLALGVSVMFLYSVFNSVVITIKKVDILKNAEKEVNSLRLENLNLSIGIKDMSTDQYLEKEARDRLNFGGKGEVVFVIPEPMIEYAKNEVNSIVNPKVEPVYESGSNIDKWLQFVVLGV